MYILPFNKRSKNILIFTSPDAKLNLIVPAFYHLFYVDCNGKPAPSLMVRFDDEADSVFWSDKINWFITKSINH